MLFSDSKLVNYDKVSIANIDINGKIFRKMEILKKEKFQLLHDMEANKNAGEKMVNLLREHGNETEVRSF